MSIDSLMKIDAVRSFMAKEGIEVMVDGMTMELVFTKGDKIGRRGLEKGSFSIEDLTDIKAMLQ